MRFGKLFAVVYLVAGTLPRNGAKEPVRESGKPAPFGLSFCADTRMLAHLKNRISRGYVI